MRVIYYDIKEKVEQAIDTAAGLRNSIKQIELTSAEFEKFAALASYEKSFHINTHDEIIYRAKRIVRVHDKESDS